MPLPFPTTARDDLDGLLLVGQPTVKLGRTLAATEYTLAQVLAKARFWQQHASYLFNLRQQQLLNKLLAGFEGQFTSSK